MATAALIGDTGFVGSNLKQQRAFSDGFRSATIHAIGDRVYDLVICAAPSAVKWRANRYPDEDRVHVDRLLSDLERVRARQFVLVSTVDVYPEPVAVDEDSEIPDGAGQPYGRHRRAVEQRVQDLFSTSLIVRLPQLFGPGLKKNFVYDLMHDQALELTDRRSRLQFYDIRRLWNDIDAALGSGLGLLNLPVEPATTEQLAKEVFGIAFTNETTAGPVTYDMRSNRLNQIGGTNPYIMSRNEWFDRLRDFVMAERERCRR